jgi:DNA-binding transcriptional ArsR family regulator
MEDEMDNFDDVTATATAARDIPRHWWTTLNKRIERALLSSKRGQIENLNATVAAMSERFFRNAPSRVQSAIQVPEDVEGAELRDAYVLGRLGSAQHLLSQALFSRADDLFAPTMQDRQYQSYVRALLDDDLSNTELGGRIEEAPETVSRKLRVLRQLGITDFRREGTFTINFLTSPAGTVARQLGLVALEPKQAILPSSVRERQKNLAPHMNQRQTFSGASDPFAEAA